MSESKTRKTASEESPQPKSRAGTTRMRAPSPLEIELLDETRSLPFVDPAWAMLDVWTQNHIYSIDGAMRCFAVLDIRTHHPIPDHPLLRGVLVGGILREGEMTRLTKPFPRPGTNAVFEQRRNTSARFSESSPVTRVILRLRQLSFATESKTTGIESFIGGPEI